jgi:hypothetical protein
MLKIAAGICHCIFVYDIAFSIDLNEAERRLSSATRESIKRKRRVPPHFEYRPAPLRVGQATPSVTICETFTTAPLVELVIYDFGAVTVIYRIPLGKDNSNLQVLSGHLYENETLLTDSRRRVAELLTLIEPALSKANISRFVEDYLIFHIESFAEPIAIETLTTQHAQEIAQVLRAESTQLSPDEVNDALSHRISFSHDDVAIVDWNAALVVDKDAEDILIVLEFANVELLEMRFLDDRLDDALGQAYTRMSIRSRRWLRFRSDPSDVRDISQWQVDSAVLFEGVNNVLKLLGDQYLARLYRLVAQRFHLAEWDGSILRKLATLETIYQKISNQISGRRMELLEWIIIILFVISIVLPFVSQNVH